jgi:hypothetical protein
LKKLLEKNLVLENALCAFEHYV